MAKHFHFILSPLGSDGDVHPMLGLARVLQSRGHRVTFITNEYFRERTEALGLSYVELGTKQEFLDLTNDSRMWHPFKALPYIFRTLIADAMRPQYELLREHYVPGETIAIASCLGLGARIARDKLDMPLITLNLQPSVMWSFVNPPRVAGTPGPRWLTNLEYRIGERFVVDPLACPGINRFRAELGLPPVRQIPRWWHSPDGVACFFPDWFAAPEVDWPRPLLQTSFPVWDHGQDDSMPADVGAFLDAGEPPIAFTPGSANIFAAQFFREAVRICQTLGRRGLLLSQFPDQIPKDLPPSVAYFSYVPFTTLLPRCAALVHHGGVGSTAQALKAGIPQLIRAMAHDQFDNGQRIKRAGVGDWLVARRFNLQRAAPRLKRLLESNHVRAACDDLAERMAERDGLRDMATELEAFATTRYGEA